MKILRLSADEARLMVGSPDLRPTIGVAAGVAAVVVESDGTDLSAVGSALGELPVVSIRVSREQATVGFDITCDDPEPLVESIERNPIAAVTTAQTLRLTAEASIGSGLAIESMAYATLQAGPEHRRWLAAHTNPAAAPDPTRRVRLDAHPDRVDIVMTWPERHNAVDSEMRDQLAAALQTAGAGDLDIRLLGEGPTFCSGGDLAEFGSVADAATGHMIRATANVAPWLSAVAARLTAIIEGPCVGAGVEMATFANRIVAGPTATFRLPETTMGLMPGAGGTVSIPRRIGRSRTLEWLLTDREIGVSEALAIGLIDEIKPRAVL